MLSPHCDAYKPVKYDVYIRTDGFIQCPLSKFIHNEMAFWSSNFLLQQIPALREPIKQPNFLQWTIDSTTYTKPTFAALGVRASAYCYQEQGEFHHSHSNPPASTDARGPLKCDRKHLGTSDDDVSQPKYIIWSPFLTFGHFATSKMNSANDSESKARQMGSALVLDILAVHLRV